MQMVLSWSEMATGESSWTVAPFGVRMASTDSKARILSAVTTSPSRPR